MTSIERRREAFMTILGKMTIGSTTCITDGVDRVRVVTRWAADAYEVDTWGKATFTRKAIAFTIAGNRD